MNKTRDMMYIALLAAVIAVLGLIPPIPVPLSPVPVTAQTLGVMLAGAVLGAKRGGLSLLVLLLLVAVGAPLLSGGRGGLSVFVTPSAGYLISWPFSAFVIGLLVEKYWDSLNVWKVFLINIVGGIVLVYAFGIPVVSFETKLSLGKAAVSAVAYLPGDLIKAFIAAWLAVRMKKTNPVIQKAASSRV